MQRSTVNLDQVALSAARVALGTAGLSATVNAALRDVARRAALADFDVLRDVDATVAEIERGRER